MGSDRGGATEILVYDGLQPCPYLEGRVARMPLYRQLAPLTPSQADARFANAERRVGRALYRTECPTCSECKGLRILVDGFRPSRSQRRVLGRWKQLGDRHRIEIAHASWSEQKLALFNRHKRARGLADPGEPDMDALGYVGWLAQSCFRTVEMRYWLDDRLVGVGILDLGRTSASSVYFYFDPDPAIARLSPGVYSTLQEIEFCRRTGRTHHYLGLYVRGSAHLAYKADYLPHERLEGGRWRRVDAREP